MWNFQSIAKLFLFTDWLTSDSWFVSACFHLRNFTLPRKFSWRQSRNLSCLLLICHVILSNFRHEQKFWSIKQFGTWQDRQQLSGNGKWSPRTPCVRICLICSKHWCKNNRTILMHTAAPWQEKWFQLFSSTSPCKKGELSLWVFLG